MREILFRGKIKGLIDWKYGSYAKCVDDHYILEDSDADDNWSIVDPETVGQYTGLPDKNGVKIFEGDIVETSHFVGDVKYGEFSYSACDEYPCTRIGYYVDHEFNGYIEGQKLPLGVDMNYVEVIGNIHDNPELLEGKNG